MKINIQARPDYTSLFNSMNSRNNSVNSSINLADYASIKSGSYGKLLKSYYAQNKTSNVNSSSNSNANSSAVKNPVKTNNKSTELTTVSATAKAVSTAANKLTNKGSDSLFKEKQITSTDANGVTSTTTGVDKQALYKGVNDFVKSYNDFVKKGSDSGSNNVRRETKNLVDYTALSKSRLSDVGISVNSDNTLTVDEKKFMNADTSKVQSLFNGNQSYAAGVAAKTSMISNTANTEAKRVTGYTNTANYADMYSAGNLLNGIM